MKSVKQNCVWAVGTLPFVKQSNLKYTNKGIVITYNLSLLGNGDVTVSFAEFGNNFSLEPIGSVYN